MTDTIPVPLRKKIPSAVLMFLEQRVFWTIFGVCLSAFFLYGPFVGIGDHNGFNYFINPVIGPLVSALYYSFKPFNPYYGPAAKWAGMVGKDLVDEDARRLVGVFRSGAARRMVWMTMIKISTLLLIIMGGTAGFFRNSINWAFNVVDVPKGLIGCALGAFIAIATQYVSWGLREWGNSYRDSRLLS